MGETKPQIRARLLSRPSPSGGVVVDTGTGECFALNSTSWHLWEQALAGYDVEGFIESLTAKFEISKREADSIVRVWVQELKRLGLLE